MFNYRNECLSVSRENFKTINKVTLGFLLLFL